MDYDVIVIGSGPAGEGAAMQAAKLGKKVAVIEEMPLVGGACTHKGTIPSKALRYSIYLYSRLRSHPIFKNNIQMVNVGYEDLLKGAESVIASQASMRRGFYDRNNITVIPGRASFDDPNSVIVISENHAPKKISSEYFIIATGSRPYHPKEVDFSHPNVKDSDTILQMKQNPRSIIIYGAGVIGCEYASIFRNLGIKVNLVNTRARLLEFLDDEITDALSYHFRDQGVLIRHNESAQSVESAEDGVVLHLKSGKKIKADILLWANGRTGNTDGMNLEQIGVKVNHRSQIEVNQNYQTSVENIFAAGDVVGYPSLASASYNQGRFAARFIVDKTPHLDFLKDIPTGIYTSPEISSIGKTEAELTRDAIPYEVGSANFRNLARAQITGNTTGILKILFHAETLEILGVHCFGSQATEIIHIGQAIIAQPSPHNSIEYFIHTTFNYPTMAEAYRVAALNGMNRVVH